MDSALLERAEFGFVGADLGEDFFQSRIIGLAEVSGGGDGSDGGSGEGEGDVGIEDWGGVGGFFVVGDDDVGFDGVFGEVAEEAVDSREAGFDDVNLGITQVDLFGVDVVVHVVEILAGFY